jgi:hypothetical protein
MANGNHTMYSITLQNIETQEIDNSFIFLNKLDAIRMSKRINEVVYKITTENKLNEWKLVEFKIKTQ